MNNSIREAINRAGGQSSLARKVGVKQPSIFRWLKNGCIPPRKVLLVESITGIPRHKLNPAIYPLNNDIESEE